MQEFYNIQGDKAVIQPIYAKNLLYDINKANNSIGEIRKAVSNKHNGWYAVSFAVVITAGLVAYSSDLYITNTNLVFLVIAVCAAVVLTTAFSLKEIQDGSEGINEGFFIPTTAFVHQNEKYLDSYGRSVLHAHYSHLSEIRADSVVVHSNDKEIWREQGDIVIEVHYHVVGRACIMEINLKFSEGFTVLSARSFSISENQSEAAA